MSRSLFFSFVVFWCCMTAIPTRTLPAYKAGASHLSSLSNEHKNGPYHEHGVHEKRKRGGRNYSLKRCNASEHSPGGKTSASSQRSNEHGESQKWGLAWPNGDASYLTNFARPKVRYLYTWSPYLPSKTPEGIEGIPMLWGWGQIDDFKRMVVEGYATKVLGMNEPNEPSQSNMSPEDGVSLWKQHIDPLKYQGYYLISPACTNDQAGLDWMWSFVKGCSGCTIDAIAFHFYGTDAEEFVRFATTLYDTYHKPIWVTEFADQNFSDNGGQASMSEIYAFQGEVVRFVDSTSWIEAAFPFGVMHDMQGVNEANSLLTADGWPTSLAYNYFG